MKIHDMTAKVKRPVIADKLKDFFQNIFKFQPAGAILFHFTVKISNNV